MKCDLFLYTLPMRSTWLTKREGLIIHVYNDKYQGWGEIAPLPPFSKETLSNAIIDAKNVQKSILNGSVPTGTVASVRWAMHCALTNLSPSIKPYYGLLGSSIHGKKLKVGHLSCDEAIHLTKKERSFGPLIIDINQAWSISKTLEYCSHFSPNDFIYIEEPVRKLDDLKILTQSNYPFAVDEMTRMYPIEYLLKQCPNLKAFVLKPMLLGSLNAIPLLKQYNKHITLSSSYESGIGLSAIIHFASHYQIHTPLGIDTYTALSSDLLKEPLQFYQGSVHSSKISPNLSSPHLKKI